VNDANDWDSEQWSKPVRRRADAWAEKLREHAHEPPVLFFAEYVDLLSFCPPARFLGKHGLIQMMADRYELFCITLPLERRVVTKLEKLRRRGQWDEDRLFGALTLAAATSWDGIGGGSVLVFLRQVISPSKEDDEIVNCFKTTPKWMRK
jgi:hypothetical protein